MLSRTFAKTSQHLSVCIFPLMLSESFPKVNDAHAPGHPHADSGPFFCLISTCPHTVTISFLSLCKFKKPQIQKATLFIHYSFRSRNVWVSPWRLRLESHLVILLTNLISIRICYVLVYSVSFNFFNFSG